MYIYNIPWYPRITVGFPSGWLHSGLASAGLSGAPGQWEKASGKGAFTMHLKKTWVYLRCIIYICICIWYILILLYICIYIYTRYLIHMIFECLEVHFGETSNDGSPSRHFQRRPFEWRLIRPCPQSLGRHFREQRMEIFSFIEHG